MIAVRPLPLLIDNMFQLHYRPVFSVIFYIEFKIEIYSLEDTVKIFIQKYFQVHKSIVNISRDFFKAFDKAFRSTEASELTKMSISYFEFNF